MVVLSMCRSRVVYYMLHEKFGKELKKITFLSLFSMGVPHTKNEDEGCKQE